MGVSHQPPVLLVSKVEDGTVIQSEAQVQVSPSLTPYIFNVVDIFRDAGDVTSTWLISLEEINLLRPEVIITFYLLKNRGISLLCM